MIRMRSTLVKQKKTFTKLSEPHLAIKFLLFAFFRSSFLEKLLFFDWALPLPFIPRDWPPRDWSRDLFLLLSRGVFFVLFVLLVTESVELIGGREDVSDSPSRSWVAKNIGVTSPLRSDMRVRSSPPDEQVLLLVIYCKLGGAGGEENELFIVKCYLG